MSLQLIIGNKNYSSWSMRAWVLMTQLRIRFEEVYVRLDLAPDSAFRREVARHSPAGRVPVLVDEGFAVWDTLAIAEYLHDKFPQAGVWPRDTKARARARSIVAEMHSGFGALRSHCPMNIEASFPEVGARILAEHAAVGADLTRIDAMWCDALTASGGPFLFGEFCAADAFYAPVAMRIRTYRLPMSPQAAGYVERLAAAPAVERWIAEALAEADFIPEDEPYRTSR